SAETAEKCARESGSGGERGLPTVEARVQEVKAVLCSSAPEPCAAADDAPAAREVEMIVSQLQCDVLDGTTRPRGGSVSASSGIKANGEASSSSDGSKMYSAHLLVEEHSTKGVNAESNWTMRHCHLQQHSSAPPGSQASSGAGELATLVNSSQAEACAQDAQHPPPRSVSLEPASGHVQVHLEVGQGAGGGAPPAGASAVSVRLHAPSEVPGAAPVCLDTASTATPPPHRQAEQSPPASGGWEVLLEDPFLSHLQGLLRREGQAVRRLGALLAPRSPPPAASSSNGPPGASGSLQASAAQIERAGASNLSEEDVACTKSAVQSLEQAHVGLQGVLTQIGGLTMCDDEIEELDQYLIGLPLQVFTHPPLHAHHRPCGTPLQFATHPPL
ncbi:hypothetical protein CYMTET_32260, partial [Cymbomonas tetramitiformis]